MEDKEILKQFKEISKNLMSRCSPDSDIYPLVAALISLFNLVINITQGLKENFVTQTKNFEIKSHTSDGIFSIRITSAATIAIIAREYFSRFILFPLFLWSAIPALAEFPG